MSMHAQPVNTSTRMDPLMTVGAAAEFLSRRQVYLLVERGELPTVRVGTRIRFIPAASATTSSVTARNVLMNEKAAPGKGGSPTTSPLRAYPSGRKEQAPTATAFSTTPLASSVASS